MELFETFQQRYSARVYQKKLLSESDLQRILQAANDAPSAGNMQAYEIVVVGDAPRKQALVKAAWDQQFIAEAPVALVFLTNPARNAERYGARGANLYAVQDATIACAYAQLAATALGLATCWVGAYDDEAVARIVNAPAGRRPVAVLPIGYAAEPPRRRPRRPLKELIHAETIHPTL
ncbi:MAG: nitroreductase [Verrucomicrobia bacterium]|nr:nitroreductase [Verrucomicrobiota bacterium]